MNEIFGSVSDWNPRASIPGIFKNVVDARATALAVSHGEDHLTYAELDRETEALAAELVTRGCRSGDRVALLFEKGVDFVISVLAVLKAGGVYVPVDPEYPAERIQLMLDMSGASLLLMDLEALRQVRDAGLATETLRSAMLVVPEWRASYDKKIQKSLDLPQVDGDDPAYIIFTSGTTGRPKGVLNAHNRVTNLVEHYRLAFGLAAADCVSQIPSFSFDASVGEIFSALLTGCHLRIFPSLKKTDPRTLTGLLERFGITFATFSPTALALVKPFVEGEDGFHLRSLRCVIVGGEPFPAELARFYLGRLPHVRFHNIYGPTETTVFCTSIEITGDLLGPYKNAVLPIGYPLANCSIRIADRGAEVAEIQVGGACVSLGYFEDAAKSAEKFSVTNGRRYYHTGDLGRIQAAGYVSITGREDDQVKIHGMRVELGEIAATIEAHADIAEAVVIVDRPHQDQVKIVAYCTAGAGVQAPDLKGLQDWLKRELPAHMLPARILLLAELPMTTSGKVDKKRLPAVDWSERAERVFVAPETPQEALLAQAFADILQVAQVSRFDNFYHLGGDSVSALRLASLLRSRGYELAPKSLVKNPQLDRLAREMEPIGAIQAPAPVSTEPFAFAPIQHWWRALNFANPHFYHQSLELRSRKKPDLAALEKALNAVIRHHDQLRACFPDYAGGRQQVAPADAVHCPVLWIESATPERRAQLGLELRGEIRLDRAPLLRAAVVQMAEDAYDIVLIAHHALVDTVSWHLIGRDLAAAYGALESGLEPVFAVKTASYFTWCRALEEVFADATTAQHYLANWRPELEVSSRRMVRTAGSAAACRTASLQTRSIALDRTATERLVNHCNTAYSTRTEELVLAAVYHALALWMDRRELCIDLEWHGRNNFNCKGLDVSHTVGWFTAIYPLLVQVDKGQDLEETLVRVKEAKRSKTCKGASFLALRHLSKTREVQSAFAGYQAPDIVFNYSGLVDELGGDWQVQPLSAVESAPENATPYAVAIEAQIRGGCLSFDLYHHEQYLDHKAAQQLLELVRHQLGQLIERCAGKPLQRHTPADFPLVCLTAREARDLPPGTAKVLPLSDIQSGIYVQAQSAPGSQMYHVQVVYEFAKPLDPKAFATALALLVRRHDALRTRFVCDRAEPIQLVDDAVRVVPEFVDFSGVSAADLEARMGAFIKEDGKRLFDLAVAPLLRVYLFRLADPGKFRVLLNIHHLIHDGWSLVILMDELSAIYDRLCAGIASATVAQALPPVAADYSDYIAAQKAEFADARARAFWEEQAHRIVECEQTPFPADFSGRAAGAADVCFDFKVGNLGAELYDALKTMARAQGITLNSLLFSAFMLLLRAVKQNDQLVVGVITSGRSDRLAGSDSIVGCCLNTLPVAVSLRNNPGLGEWLQSVHQQLADLVDQCLFPLSEVASMARRVSGNSELGQLFDCTYDFESYRQVADGEANRPAMVGGYEMTNYGMEINILEERNNLSYRITYDPTRFKSSTADRWMSGFSTLLGNLVAAEVSAAALSLSAIPAGERVLLNHFSGFSAPYPAEESVHHFVERFAREIPGRIAVEDADGRLTYRELNQRANRIAGLLIEQGVQPDTPVAVLLDRSTDFIATVVGIWKAGAAYMPIDPEYPQDRVNTLIENARAVVTVTTGPILATFGHMTGVSRCVCIDGQSLEPYASDDINLPFKPQNLAYVLFTSGSTGTPKGVMIEHRGMMNNLQSEVNDFDLDGDSVIAQTASQCFDVSVWQCFAGLIVGAKVCVYGKDLQLDPEAFVAKCFVADRVTNLQLVPSYVNELMNFLQDSKLDLPQVRILSITGEALKLPVLERWLSLYPHVPVVNAYGPAEASDDITHHIFREVPADGVIPIGKPTQNAYLYILDSHQQLCPLGVVGEICVAGVCVGRGYIHDPERTAASFGTDPVRGDGSRFYRTGDLGRWREDGVLEFHGRKDYQVKVNGFRVELGEIENQLSLHEDLSEVAVVMHRRSPEAHPILTAFVTALKPLKDADLRAFIAGKVPGHMVPARFVVLEKLPANTSGKLDKKRLQSWPLENGGRVAEAEITRKERILHAALQAVFNIERYDRTESFFSVGGDSLKALQLISAVKNLGGRLGAQDVFLFPRFADLAELIEVIAPTAVAAVEPVRSGVEAALPAADRELLYGGHLHGFELDNIAAAYPLSSLQEGILFHHLLADGGAYLGRYVLEIAGDLQLDLLEAALNAMLDRHEALRTSFVYEKVSRPLQVVLKRRHSAIRRHDISRLDTQTRDAWLKDLYERESLTPFDLGGDVLLRVNAVKLGAEHHQLFITSHHIVMDGWSVANLIQDLLHTYGEALGIHVMQRETVPQFQRYVAWLAGQDKNAALAHFTQYLADYGPVSLKLPCAVPGAPASGTASFNRELGLSQYSVRFGEPLTQALEACAKALEVTVNAVFRVLWGLALQRYTYSTDVVFGNVISGRFPEIEDVNTMVGSLINTLPVRIQCTGDETLGSLIQKAQREFVAMEKHGHLALSEIQNATGLKEPLFDHILVSDNFPIDVPQLNARAGNLGFTFKRIEGGVETNYDLTVLLTSGADFVVTFEYKDRVFAEHQLSCVGAHLRQLAQRLCADPTLRVRSLTLLGDAEAAYIVDRLSQGTAAIRTAEDLLTQMRAVFVKHADKTALRFGGAQVSFRELDAAANHIALELRRRGIGKDGVVPLLAERSFEMVAAILGILRAGGAYLPIDPTLPIDRINFILQDVRPRVVLAWNEEWISAHQSQLVLPLTPVRFRTESAAELVAEPRASDSLTYIIYTSGSTGQPKGVQIEDGALINRLLWMARSYDISDKDTILQKTVFTFDVSVWELLLPFLTGATMSLLEQGAERSPDKIVAQIERDAVSVLHFVPSMLSAFVQEMPRVEQLPKRTASLVRCFTSGEALNPHHAETFFHYFPKVKLHNLYGPTEAAIDVSDYTVAPGDTRVPIGKPVNGTQLYILDIFNQPAPMGIPGELHIGGVQLARGYHNRPELTCERFSRGLFEDGRILYKTGDLSLWLEDANIAYLGRMDHQVKIRGFRIELGEIETRLCDHERVKDAAVIAVDSASGSKQLVAFYVPQGQVDAADLRNYLLECLPKYMVPADFIALATIPQTGNGKLDRKALLRVSDENRLRGGQAAPAENDMQRLLLQVWKDVLNDPSLGVDDNFFNVRGDSILAIQIASRIQNFGYRFNVEAIFNYPTVRELAAVLEPLNASIDQGEFQGDIPATPVQCWFAERVLKERHHWNQSIALSALEIQPQAAAAALQLLWQRHDMLRSRARFYGAGELTLSVPDTATAPFTGLTRVAVRTESELDAAAMVLQSGLDLESGPLFRAGLFRFAGSDLLLLVAHHLVVDGVSWRILLEDFTAAYQAFSSGKKPQLPPKTHSFAEWQRALAAYAQNRKLLAETSYWNVVDSLGAGQLPGLAGGFGNAAASATVLADIDRTLTQRLLEESGRAYSTNADELLLCAVAAALGRWRDMDEVRIDLESHGREAIAKDLDVTRTVGWFTSVFPVLLSCGRVVSIAQHIKTVKERLRAVPVKGVGYGVLRHVCRQLAARESQVLFNYLGQLGDGKVGGFSVSSRFSAGDLGPNTELLYPLELVSFVERGQLRMKLVYSTACVAAAEAEALLASIKESIHTLIDHCCAQEGTAYTPSDFSAGDIDMDELDTILDAIE